MRAATSHRRLIFIEAIGICCRQRSTTPDTHSGISAIRILLIVVLALCAESFLLHGRRNNRMAAMIKSHPGLKPLEEVDSEMSELIAQEQRRQACAQRP